MTTGLEPGDLLAARYRVERVLGRGGMGVVVAAFDERLAQRVALKVMTSRDPDADAAERFLREARALRQLDDEHHVRVFDIDALDDGTPYIVMEHVLTLDRLDSGRPLDNCGQRRADRVAEGA